MFFFILLLPVDSPKTEEIPKITSSTRTDWGYTVDYCDQFYEQSAEHERHENGSGVVFFKNYKSYCSI